MMQFIFGMQINSFLLIKVDTIILGVRSQVCAKVLKQVDIS